MTSFLNFQSGSDPAGQDERAALGNWEKATNKQQKRLVRAYDAWGVKVRKELSKAAIAGATELQMTEIIDRHLPLLDKKITDITTEGIGKASRLSVPGMVDQPEVIAAQRTMINNTTRMVREAFLPRVRESLVLNIGKMTERNAKAVVAIFRPMRSGVAQYAGGFWEAIFESQRAGGMVLEREAVVKGEKPPQIKWVLDKRAEHCADSPGYFGCPGLAGVYDKWGDLPTVPAGRVTCRGNCRCHLEVKVNGKWQRGL